MLFEKFRFMSVLERGLRKTSIVIGISIIGFEFYGFTIVFDSGLILAYLIVSKASSS